MCANMFSVTNEVVVVVILVLVEDIWTIITDISYSITILVCLVRIVHSRTVVFCVGDEVIVNIWIAHISQLIPICVLLFRVDGDESDLEESEKNRLPDSFAVVACIPSSIPVFVFL